MDGAYETVGEEMDEIVEEEMPEPVAGLISGLDVCFSCSFN